MSKISKRGATTAAIAIVAGATATTAVAVPPPPSANFKGSTSQTKEKDHGAQLTTNANGRVLRAYLEWTANRCDKGVAWRQHQPIKRGSKGLAMKHGVFHRKGTFSAKPKGAPGITGKVSYAFKGHFTDKRHAKGTFTATVRVFRDGDRIDTCRTPKKPIRWHVKRVG